MSSVARIIANEARLPLKGVEAALELFSNGDTLPFVARYRKERTGGLDEVALRTIKDLQKKVTEVNDRRQAVLKAIEKLNKLTPALKLALTNATTKQAVEDLYAPFKTRRKSRAEVAKRAGLEPLAEAILRQKGGPSAKDQARRFVSGDIKDVEQALAGAQDIVAEVIATHAPRRAHVRRAVFEHGVLVSKLKKGKEAAQFRDYADFHQRAKHIVSHRVLAIYRGEEQGVLSVKLDIDQDRLLNDITRHLGVRRGSPFAEPLLNAAKDALKRLLLPSAVRTIRKQLKATADEQAITVFEKNLHALLMSAPYGAKSVIGIDPGIRTGCKCAVVGHLGEFIAYKTLYLVGRKQVDEAGLLAFINAHNPAAVAVGNGTGGRETEKILRDLKKKHNLSALIVMVSEAGASVYSASELAGAELPDVDLTVRGAISIARRLQDPLAELVKVPPQSLGVGQYQHDVDQSRLTKQLNEVIETCVNQVGVNLNTASPALLSHVAGLGNKRAAAIVSFRQENRAFERRSDLMKVPGLGKKSFEQCAGFLRITGAKNPLDNSAVHPERYPLVRKMAADLGVPLTELIGSKLINTIPLKQYTNENTGLATLTDIVSELNKPGRDPRQQFETTEFDENIHQISDLQVSMELNGVITNVTSFGAFVDIGVHQDGLVHVSQLSNRFVKDPLDVVAPGQKVRVKVLDVDQQRKRISLSMKAVDS